MMTREATRLGSEFDPFSPELVDDPYPALARARAVAPVFWSEKLDAWVVVQHGLLDEIFRAPELFPSSGLGVMTQPPDEVRDILSTLDSVAPLRATDPPDHARQRRPTLAAVAPRRIAAMEPALRRTANELVDSFVDDGAADFHSAFSLPFPLRVISGVLGLPDDVAESLRYWSACRVALAWGRMELEEWKKAARGVVEFHNYMRSQVDERRIRPRDDGLSEFIHNATGAANPMTVSEIVEQAIALITGGHETTASWVTLSLYHLLLERGRWETYVSGQWSTAQLVEETLRYDSPVRAVWRKAGADLDLGGVALQAGDRIYCVISAANRDPAVFDSPADFEPSRENARLHLAFGRATHHCLGAGLARLECAIALETVAARLPGLELETGTLRCVENATLRTPSELRVRWS